MNDPVRYDGVCNDWNGEYAGLAPTKDGDWVRWDDYARLKAEIERLKEAGDMMAFHIGNDVESQLECADAWRAAKGGNIIK